MLKINGIFVEMSAADRAIHEVIRQDLDPKLFHSHRFSQCGPKHVTNHPALRRDALTTHDLA
jgi:hypothetical protein